MPIVRSEDRPTRQSADATRRCLNAQKFSERVKVAVIGRGPPSSGGCSPLHDELTDECLVSLQSAPFRPPCWRPVLLAPDARSSNHEHSRKFMAATGPTRHVHPGPHLFPAAKDNVRLNSCRLSPLVAQLSIRWRYRRARENGPVRGWSRRWKRSAGDDRNQSPEGGQGAEAWRRAQGRDRC
jgi:hypothetical protein